MSDRKPTDTHIPIAAPSSHKHGVLLSFSGPPELAEDWQKFARGYLAENMPTWQLRQLSLLNELAFAIPASVTPSGNPKRDAIALTAAVSEFIQHNGKTNIERLHSDLYAVINANASINPENPLNKAIVDKLSLLWSALRTAKDAPAIPDQLIRNSPQWQEMETILATREGSLLSGAIFASSDMLMRNLTHRALRNLQGRRVDFETLYTKACATWQSTLFRFDSEQGHFLHYLQTRLSGTRGILVNSTLKAQEDDELDAPLNADSDVTHKDQLTSENAEDPFLSLSKADSLDKVIRAIDTCLSPREAAIIKLSYGLGEDKKVLNHEQIAQMGGVSRQAISRIALNALEKLKAHLALREAIPARSRQTPLAEAETTPAEATSVVDQIISGCNAALRKANPDKGYIADALPHIMRLLELSDKTLALQTGIYPSFIEAYKTGEIVPSGEAFAALKKAINPHGENGTTLNQLLNRLVERDNNRLESLYPGNPNRLSVVRALGTVTKDMHLHHFMDAIINKNPHDPSGLHYQDITQDSTSITDDTLRTMYYQSRKHEGKQRRVYSRHDRAREIVEAFANGVGQSVGDTSGLYATLINDFLLQKHPKQPFTQIFDAYMAKDKPTLGGLFDFAAEQWQCTFREAGQEIGLGSGRFVRDDVKTLAADTLQDMARRQGFSIRQTDDLVALRKGTLELGTVESLTRDAQTLLNDSAPTYEVYKNNPLVQQMKEAMPSLAHLSGDAPIPKNLIPNALVGCLIKRGSNSATDVFAAIGKTMSFASEVIRGEREFFAVHKKGATTEYQADKALDAAKYFSTSPATIETLSLAFLEIGRKQSPDELMAQVTDKKLAIGEMVRICRLQNHLTRATIAATLSPNDRAHAHWLSALEKDNDSISEALATGLADIFYKPYPQATSKAEFILAVRGKAVDKNAAARRKAEAIARIEKNTEEAYARFGQKDAPCFADILPDIKDISSNGSVPDFNAQLSTFCGKVSRSSFYEWRKPERSVQILAQAEGIADMAIKNGVNPALRDKLVHLARKTVPTHEVQPDAADSAQSRAEELAVSIAPSAFEPSAGGYAAKAKSTTPRRR